MAQESPAQKQCTKQELSSGEARAGASFAGGKRFGQLIFEARTLRRESQAQLARVSGLSRTYISEIENGRVQSPPQESAVRIAKALQLGPAEQAEILQAAVLDRAPGVIFPASEAKHILRLAKALLERAPHINESQARRAEAALLQED